MCVVADDSRSVLGSATDGRFTAILTVAAMLRIPDLAFTFWMSLGFNVGLTLYLGFHASLVFGLHPI